MNVIPFIEKLQKHQKSQSPGITSQSQSYTQNSMFQNALNPINRNFKVRPHLFIKYEEDENKRNMQEILPKSFFENLYQFQKEGVQFGINNYGRLLIGDEMGVGKTIQALAIAYVYKDHWPLLIICPALLMLNWRDEANKWIEGLDDLYDIQVISKQKDTIQQQVKIIITSYDLAVHHVNKFDGIRMVIADEAHHLKSFVSKRVQILTPFLKTMRHVLLLTGTPALARPKEIYNLITIIRPDVFFNFKEFGNRYCDPKKSRYKQGFDYEGCSNPIELHRILTHSIMIRRLKKDVLDQLPSKIRQNIKIEVDKQLQKEIMAIIRQNSDRIDSMLGGAGQQQFEEEPQAILNPNVSTMHGNLALIQKCYLLTGLSKVDGICQYLEEIIDDSFDQKFLVFAHHIAVLDKLEALTKKNRWNYIRIDGNVSAIERHSRVQSFQTDTKIQIALLSLTAASVGITMTAAQTVIFAEIHWTPGIMQQAEDRAHRIGQKSCVSCIYLLGEQTLDDRVMQTISRKQNNLSFMLDGGTREFYKEVINPKETWTPRKNRHIEDNEQSRIENQELSRQQFHSEAYQEKKLKIRTIESFFPKLTQKEPSTELLQTQKKKPEEFQELLNFISELNQNNQDPNASTNEIDEIFNAIEMQQKKSK